MVQFATDACDFSVGSASHSNHAFGSTSSTSGLPGKPTLEWDWDIEHADRRSEAKADAQMHGAQPFQVDRRVLKDVVTEKMGAEVGRIQFLSSGTFHKAYLVTLVDAREVVTRVARRFMPRLKTQSEVATLQYLRQNTPVPVPTVYHYDSNPYNRLGGEYIIMSKAPGIPLSKVYHSMPHDKLVGLLRNIAHLVIPLFAHRFSHLGSLYISSAPHPDSTSSVATPTATHAINPMSRQLSMTATAFDAATPKPSALPRPALLSQKTITPAAAYHVGPIISWPFFGSNRGDDAELNRGPWDSTHAYLSSCMEREITGVVRESEGKAAPHRLHLDPDEILSSRHHHMQAVPGDESDSSDEWDMEESEEEWDGPGDTMYRDYRRMQRSTFLVAHVVQREEAVRKEMQRWINVMERLGVGTDGGAGGKEEFGLDCHDLSLENIFVDANDHSKITCVIDWESTTTRPLWACAHLPAFLLSSPFTAKLFRAVVANMADSALSEPNSSNKSKDYNLADLANEWLHYERTGSKLRMAHRCAEWDGWEEGLVDSILGPEEHEEEWYRETASRADGMDGLATPPLDSAGDSQTSRSEDILVASLKRRNPVANKATKLPAFAKEEEKEKMLNTTGDICGGRGGELGRRLEAWLSVNGIEDGVTDCAPVLRRWDDDDSEYEAEAE